MFVQDSELLELRETIEALKSRNEEAQAVIQGALNNPDNMKGLELYQLIFVCSLFLHICLCFDVELSWFPDLRIRRQNSCESISSLNSLTSVSSVGSLKDQDAKKKKKKSWVRMDAFRLWASIFTLPALCLSVFSPLWYWQSSMDNKIWPVFPPLLCYFGVLGLWGECNHCVP